MDLIHLQTPTATDTDLRRLNLFAGRHLGEVELDRAQHYADARLAHVLAGARPGILHGLEAQETVLGSDGPGIVVQPGTAVGGDGRALGLVMALRETWLTLLDNYAQESRATDRSGFYYLVLRRGTEGLDYSVDVDACRRTVADPYRDTRLVTIGTVALRRLSIDDKLLTLVPQRAANRICAAQLVASVFDPGTGEVPLGLLAVRDPAGASIAWFNAPAGRYLAQPNAGQRVLAAQVEAAIVEAARAAMTAGDNAGFPAHFVEHISLSYLPPAGALPLQLLSNPAGLATDPANEQPALSWPKVVWGMDMVPVPRSQIAAVLERELSRGPLHLDAPAAGDRLRLLLAVADRDYRTDLLDRPATDASIEDDVYGYARSAYEAWSDWTAQYRFLYHRLGTDGLSAQDYNALGVPAVLPAPESPRDYFQGLIQDELAARGIDYSNAIPYRAELGQTPLPEALPLPYRDGIPDRPASYTDWLVDGERPPPAEPTVDGLVIQYAIQRNTIDAQQNHIQDLQSRLERARDYLLLQRQQLDAQTVSFASLAGGVAGDGSGLQITRWLRYSKFDATSTSTDGGGGNASGTASTGTSGSGTNTGGTGATASGTSSVNFATYASSILASNYQPVMSFAPAGGGGTFTQQASQTPDTNLNLTTQLFKQSSIISGGQLSNLEYALQASKFTALDQAWASNRFSSAPSVEVEPHQFGVIGHITPHEAQYRSSYEALGQLREATLKAVFNGEDFNAFKTKFDTDKMAAPKDLLDPLPADSPYKSITDPVQRHYKALFDLGDMLTRHISIIENFQAGLAAQLVAAQKALQDMQAELLKLASRIAAARDELDTFNGRRLNALGDYAMAQRLLEENWRTVENVYLERRRILANLQGLYYVRVRHAPLAEPLAAPLPLRHGASDDIVPGCADVTDPVLPDALGVFVDAVLEIPLADWNGLAPLRYLLPDTARLQQMIQLRQARLAVPPIAHTTATTSAQRLSGLMSATHGVLMELVSRPWTLGHTLKQNQSAGASVLSLQDVISGPPGELRRRAVQRRDRLEQALSCLIGRLPAVPPSVRLQWAQAAEADQLAVDAPQHWPALALAQGENFNSARTIVELVGWWFRQLRDGAAAASRTAMRNAVRAVLIQAAYGTASDILHGSVQTVPGRFQLGELMRVQLNRTPPTGAKLQLLDSAQQLVGLVRVEDSDPQGATVSIINVIKPAATLATDFMVIATRNGQ